MLLLCVDNWDTPLKVSSFSDSTSKCQTHTKVAFHILKLVQSYTLLIQLDWGEAD